MNNLPTELLLHIASFLKNRELLYLGYCSSYLFKQIVRDLTGISRIKFGWLCSVRQNLQTIYATKLKNIRTLHIPSDTFCSNYLFLQPLWLNLTEIHFEEAQSVFWTFHYDLLFARCLLPFVTLRPKLQKIYCWSFLTPNIIKRLASINASIDFRHGRFLKQEFNYFPNSKELTPSPPPPICSSANLPSVFTIHIPQTDVTNNSYCNHNYHFGSCNNNIGSCTCTSQKETKSLHNGL